MSPLRRIPVHAVVLFSLLLLPSFADAGTYNWDGGGSDDNIADANNWQSNLLPPNDGTALLNFRGTQGLNPYNLTMWFLDGIAFPNDGTTQFKISGARLYIGDAGINDYRSFTQTINNAITLTSGVGQHQWIANPGFLELRGDIDMASIPVKVWGGGEVRLFGDVTGVNGSIDVGWSSAAHPAGTLRLSGLVNVDVDTHIGTLIVDTNQPQPPTTTLQFSNGTTLQAIGTHVIENTLQLNGDVTYGGNGYLTLTQNLTGSGNLRIATSSSGAGLELGPINNFSTFSGQVSIEHGSLVLHGSGILAQLGGTVLVGDASGSQQTARLGDTNVQDLGTGVAMTVYSDGWANLVGDVQLASLNLVGGDFDASSIDVEPLTAGGSGRTANLGATWLLSTPGQDYDLVIDDGPANPDIKLLQGCDGPGTLRVTGGGQAMLLGNAADGPAAIDVQAGDLTLARASGPSVLAEASAANAVIHTQGSGQLGAGCQLNLLPGSVLDISSQQEEVAGATLTEAQVTGSGGLLTLHGDLNVFGTVDVEPYLSFAIPSAGIDLDPGALLTTGSVDGSNMFLLGGGRMRSEEINGNFTITEGTLEFFGFLDGDLDVFDTLELNRDQGVTQVNGSVDCGPDASLVIDLDASGANAGDEFSLIQCQQITGSFRDVQFPAAPTDHFWTLLYLDDELRLRLDAIAQAELDMESGDNGQLNPLFDGLEGVAGFDFTIQGFDDVELCSVSLDSIASPLQSSTLGVRLYAASSQTLLASTEHFVAQRANPGSEVFPLHVLLQPLEAYRLVFYGTGNLRYRAYTPDLSFPYAQSTLVELDGAYADLGLGDVFPTGPVSQFPPTRITLGPCDLTAAPPEPTRSYRLALRSYPNPFNPSTTVSFELPHDGRVRIDVIDVRGRHLATLVDEPMPAGDFEVHWDGEDARGNAMSSGVYFLRLSHPAGQKTHRVLLIK